MPDDCENIRRLLVTLPPQRVCLDLDQALARVRADYGLTAKGPVFSSERADPAARRGFGGGGAAGPGDPIR